MDNSHTGPVPKQDRANLCKLLLLLFLTAPGLQLVLSAEGHSSPPHNNGGLKLNFTIVGPDFVTVGVPSSFECYSTCTTCTFSMSVDGLSAQGQDDALSFTLQSWRPALTVTCTVTNETGPSSQVTATATKQLQVLAGPANVSISGPDWMTPTVKHTYSCNAYCRPSCAYAWRTDKGPWVSGPGNVVTITPSEEDKLKMLTCKASNTVSGLYVTASRNVGVITGPSDLHVRGPAVIDLGRRYKIECRAECLPSCRYLSSVDSQTVRGSAVEVTLEHPRRSVNVTCRAENTASRKTASAFRAIPVKGRNESSRPEAPAALLLAAIVAAALGL